MSDALRSVGVVRVRGAARTAESDRAATEEPLEVRLHGQPFAVIMRTPGADRELAAGFLLAERVIAGADDLGTIVHCTDAAADHPENVVNVTLADGSAAAVERLLAGRRQVTTNSSCGMCGRRTIESLAADVAPIAAAWRVTAALINASGSASLWPGWSGRLTNTRSIGVSIAPGQIALTRMPSLAWRLARLRASPITPALAAE